MKLKIGIVMLAGALMACPGANQPKPDCLVGHGEWVLNYKLTSGVNAGTCDDLQGELVGIQKYLNRAEKTEVFIKVGQLFDAATDFDDPAIMAHGEMTSTTPDANNLCNVPTLTDATQGALRYTFSDVSFFVTSQVQGTQMKAKLTYNDGTCAATYDVFGVYPVVYCEELVQCPFRPPDPRQDPRCQYRFQTHYVEPARAIDPVWCNQTNNLFVNNSIHPDVKTSCNQNINPTYNWADVSTTPVQGWCVIDEFPAFKTDANGVSRRLY